MRAPATIASGSVAILPMDVGYSLIADVPQHRFGIALPPPPGYLIGDRL